MEFTTAVLDSAANKPIADGCRPEFYFRSVHFDGLDAAAGKPVFKDVEYVRIVVPGDKTSQVDRKVRPEDLQRWPQQYAAWKANNELPMEGMPLEKWTLISPAEVDTFKYFKVRTVEDLAKLTDTQIQNLGTGAMRLRKEAIAWVQQAEGNAGISKVAVENERLNIELAGVKRQLQELLDREGGGAEPEPPRGALDDPPPAGAKRTRTRARAGATG